MVSISLVPCNDDATPVKESFKDNEGNMIENDHPGYIVAGNETGSGSRSNIALDIPSGDYIVRIDSILNNSVYTSKYLNKKLTYKNPNTLDSPSGFRAWAGGDGQLNVSAGVPTNATGISFNIYKKLPDGSYEHLPAMGGYVGNFDKKGSVSTYFKGDNTVLDENGVEKYTSSIVPGETYRAEAFAAGKDIKKEMYLVLGTDKNTSKYTDSIPENSTFRSDIIQVAANSDIDKLLLDFEVIGEGNNDNLGIYKYSDSINKWIYIGGEYNAERNMMSLDISSVGRYAVIENPKMSKIEFADIANSWAALYIRSLAYASLTDGYLEDGERYYKPANEITRGEFVKMLVCATGADTSSSDVSMFADSDNMADWVKPYASAAFNAGWFKGSLTDDGIMANLSDKITRQDAMTLVYRVFFDSEKSGGKLGFADSSNVSEYATGAVSYLTECGIVSLLIALPKAMIIALKTECFM